MTGEEALGILGLTHPDAAGIRAAYLRLIRVHKPDTDPEGFRRVRGAYELLTRPAAVRSNRDEGSSGPERRTSPLEDGTVGFRGPRPPRSGLAEGLRRIADTVGQASAKEAEARVRDLPQPSIDDPSPERILEALHLTMGKLLTSGYRTAARELLSRFGPWLAVHGPSGRDPVGFRTAWAVRVELAGLHPDFPSRWVRALAEASETGNYEAALEKVSRRSIATIPERFEASTHLPPSGFLHQLLSPRLGARFRRFGVHRFESNRVLSALGAWTVLIAVLVALKGVGSCTRTQEHTRVAYLYDPYLLEQELNSRFATAQAELTRLCGRSLETGECARALTALDEVAWGQCPRASADLGFLPASRWVALREVEHARCVALLLRKDGDPLPNLAYRSESELAATGLCSLAEESRQGWWCERAQTMVTELKSERCPQATAVLADFRKRLDVAPPVSPFDRAVASDLARAQTAMLRHCGDAP
jgi:hypothetical protein